MVVHVTHWIRTSSYPTARLGRSDEQGLCLITTLMAMVKQAVAHRSTRRQLRIFPLRLRPLPPMANRPRVNRRCARVFGTSRCATRGPSQFILPNRSHHPSLHGSTLSARLPARRRVERSGWIGPGGQEPPSAASQTAALASQLTASLQEKPSPMKY